MTSNEWAKLSKWIESTCGKGLSAASNLAYYECLGHLDYAVARTAAKRVVFERVYQSFPSVAEIAQAASDVQQGHVSQLSESDAWAQALAFAKAGSFTLWGKDVVGTETWGSLTGESMADRQARLPVVVQECVKRFGFRALEDVGTKDLGYSRNAFGKIFHEVSAEHKRRALLPPSLVREIESHAPRAALSPVAARAVAMIGVEKPETKKGKR